MSKKPYIIQQGSNNLVIVPTESYEPSPKKVKLDTANFIEKVPVPQKRESVISNASNKVNPGASSRNSNVLIDVSKVKRQQSSWAANFLQSIGGTSSKPPKLYPNLAKKSTLLRKENTQSNTYLQTTALKAENDTVYELNASKLLTQSNAKTISTQTKSNVAATEPKANKDERHPDMYKLPTHPRATNKDVHKLLANKIDSKPKPLQEILQIRKETNQISTHTKPVPLKVKEATKAAIKSKQKKSNTEANNQLKAHKITTQATSITTKVNKEATKLKDLKGISKTKIKKEISSAKLTISKKPQLKKDDIIVNMKKSKISENNRGNIKSNRKESQIGLNESLHKESIKSKSPIKSVVKKISNYQMQDSNNHYYKKSDYSPLNEEHTLFTDSDADLRSKLKRKYPNNDISEDEESRDNRNLNNKFSNVPKNKGFVPNENLIISFNAESDKEGKVKATTPVKPKTKKQKTGGNKCKKIKLQINIILQNSNTSDESENEEDVESNTENTDLSFLDDFNIDEIVESLNDCKNSKAKTSAGIIAKGIPKAEMSVETMDITYEDTKRKREFSSVESDVDKYKGVLQSTIQNQRTSYLNDCIKIDGNTLSINETKVKNEVQNPDPIDKCDKTLHSDKCNIKNICSDDDIIDTAKIELQSVTSPIHMTNQVDNYIKNSHGISNDKTSEVKVVPVEPKTTQSLYNNETKKDSEQGISINDKLDNEYYKAEVKGQQHLVEKVTVDLTLNKDDNLSQTESDDIVIVDVEKPCLIEVNTEPILILNTDDDTGIDLKSSAETDENENSGIYTNVVESTDRRSESVETVVDLRENKLNDGYEKSNTVLQIQPTTAKSDNSANQNNLENNKKQITSDKKNKYKLEAKDGKSTAVTDKSDNSVKITDENNLAPNEKNITVEKKIHIKPENAKVQSQSSLKTQQKIQNNKDQLPNNNNDTMTNKNTESSPKPANNSLTKDTLARKLEARMETYLGEKHHITEFIHRGRYSTLYRYEDVNGRKNTIKVLKKESDRYYLGVLKEKMLMNLQQGVPEHNLNCVRLINGFSMAGLWCFLMEYYPKNLQEVLEEREQGFHIDVVQKLSGQLVSAVTILRNNNIIHSDIKPSHILLNDDETKLKLCGFDQAFYYDNSQLFPNVGTVNYRAPELILGYPADYSIDVWSTALVMYEMATNRKLFPGNYNNDILYKQLCTLDHIPFDMMLHSRFRNKHFIGNAFARIVGTKGEYKQLITNLYKKDRIHSVLFQGYATEWSKQTAPAKRREDKAKLFALSNLLKQMLVIHPKHRIDIEFVFANPFMYETFDA